MTKNPEPETIVDQLLDLEGKLLVKILTEAIEVAGNAEKNIAHAATLEKLCLCYCQISEHQQSRESHIAAMVATMGASYLGDVSEDCYKHATMTPELKELLDRREGEIS